MAAFSNYEDSNMSPFLADSVYLHNHPMVMRMIMSGFMEDQAMAHEITMNDDNEPSVTRKQSSESSTVVDKLDSGEQVTQKLTIPTDNKRKTRNGFFVQSKDGREKKGKKQKQCIKQQQKPKAEKKKTEQEAPNGYIHVRARRGQATDSHSLAERVRRERISERMKILQKLVPGCDKVTGKALMLDEIINYVQSLQNQVEFLSMKLASVNPMLYHFGMDQDSVISRPSERLHFQTAPVPTVFADTQPQATTTTTALHNNYTLVPDTFPQDKASLLWDVEEQGQKFLNPSGFNHNLYSFN